LVILLAPGLSAQQTNDKNKKATEAKSEEGHPPITLGVSVDAARKSSDLPHTATTEDNQGETWQGYVTKQSIEFGGRISDFTGNQGTWDTYVNMGSGPRLLEYTLDMHAPDHAGLMFDDLSFANFGYGGDPSNMSRLRFSKGAVGARSFEEGATHSAMMEEIKNNQMSCVSSGCHDTIHNVAQLDHLKYWSPQR